MLLQLSGAASPVVTARSPRTLRLPRTTPPPPPTGRAGSVKTLLGRLAARGLIEQGYGGVVVRAPKAMRAFVDDG